MKQVKKRGRPRQPQAGDARKMTPPVVRARSLPAITLETETTCPRAGYLSSALHMHPDKATRVRYLASMQPITTTASLADACARMTRHPFVTVDTEFLRESTYYPRLCVAQMASTDEAIVIDTLADGIDFTPFFALMANENVVKVFHAARQDIEICWHEAGIIPSPIIDTQVAAMVLGYGDAISYDQLVQRVTGDNLDKSHRFTDWTRRPLSEAQLAYAISDVTHLRDVYLK